MSVGLIRLVVVDPNWLVRLALANLFQNLRHFALVAEASTATAALAAVSEHAPDVVIMDLDLPDGSGVQTCRQIRSDAPQTRVVVLTLRDDEDAVIGAIRAGASGYLLKYSDPEQLIAAVEAAASGGSLLDPAVTDIVLRWTRSSTPGHGSRDGLSEQESKILPLIAHGKTNRQIAAELYLSEHTVKTYVSKLLKKLQLGRRAEVAAYAVRHTELRAS
jgi:two-component system, NarL family, response regulator DevR